MEEVKTFETFVKHNFTVRPEAEMLWSHSKVVLYTTNVAGALTSKKKMCALTHIIWIMKQLLLYVITGTFGQLQKGLSVWLSVKPLVIHFSSNLSSIATESDKFLSNTGTYFCGFHIVSFIFIMEFIRRAIANEIRPIESQRNIYASVL